MNRTRIILVDSSELVRMGVRALLADARELGAEIVGEASDAASAVAAVRSQAPDLVITELELPDESGVTLAGMVRDLAPATRVLVLASVANEVSVRQATVAGVMGYVLKAQPAREILAAIGEAAAGRHVPPPPTRGAAVSDAPEVPRARAAVLERLSAREREIFNLIIWGQTNKQVAVKLGISVKTVETHRSHINGKLQVHSAAELVRLASLCGVLGADDGGAVESASTAHASREKPPGKVAVERELPRLVAKIG